MAKKISELTELTTVNDSDLLHVVDVDDTTMSSSGTNKKATKQNFLKEVTQDISDLDSNTVKKNDTDVSGNSWVVDEDDMASDSDEKVPTQQSVKAYVDNNATSDWNSQTDVIPTRTSADDPTYVIQFAGVDLTSKVSVGQKISWVQNVDATAYYKFQGNSNDEQGSHNGTDTDITYSTGNGRFNQGAGFNGSTSKIQVSNPDDFKTSSTNIFTMGCWFKTSTTGTTMTLFASEDTSSTNSLLMMIHPDKGLSAYSDVTNWISSNENLNAAHCDGNWHFGVIVYNGRLWKVYVDGELIAKKVDSAPSDGGTRSVIIGQRTSGIQQFNGSLDELFFVNGSVVPHTKIRKMYESEEEIGSFPIQVQKYGFVTALSVSGGNTSLTLYGGTDYDVDDTSTYAISDVKFSSMKAPYGFPLDPDKWSEEVTDSDLHQTSSPTANTWYDSGVSLSIPIGIWNVYNQHALFVEATNTGYIQAASTLSSSTSSSSNSEFDAQSLVKTSTNDTDSTIVPVATSGILSLSSKTTFHVIYYTPTSGVATVGVRGATSQMIIKATIAYL